MSFKKNLLEIKKEIYNHKPVDILQMRVKDRSTLTNLPESILKKLCYTTEVVIGESVYANSISEEPSNNLTINIGIGDIMINTQNKNEITYSFIPSIKLEEIINESLTESPLKKRVISHLSNVVEKTFKELL